MSTKRCKTCGCTGGNGSWKITWDDGCFRGFEACPDCCLHEKRVAGQCVRCRTEERATGRDIAVVLCPACDGTGLVLGTVCRVCDGNGRRPPIRRAATPGKEG